MNQISALDFYQQKHELKPGVYLVSEHDETESIAIIKDCECICVEWLSVEEYEERERREINEQFWINDGIDLIYGED